jgi:hypothetical protein
MKVEGIGQLEDLGSHWRLTYDKCGHTQAFALLPFEESYRAIRQVQRNFAKCLTCRSVKRISDATPLAMLGEFDRVAPEAPARREPPTPLAEHRPRFQREQSGSSPA